MKIMLTFLMVFTSASVMAQKSYISGVQKVTFRVAAGKTEKIIKMLETETAVTVLEAGEEWTKVKDADGNEGYVLNRFLTKDVPFSKRYEWLKNKYDKLEETNKSLNEQMAELKKELSQTKSSLSETEKNLSQTSSSFEELKTGSADYLNLKKKYEKTEELLGTQTTKVKELQAKVSTYYIFWFLAGGGVLFLGWLIGLFSRKRKKYGSSLSF